MKLEHTREVRPRAHVEHCELCGMLRRISRLNQLTGDDFEGVIYNCKDEKKCEARVAATEERLRIMKELADSAEATPAVVDAAAESEELEPVIKALRLAIKQVIHARHLLLAEMGRADKLGNNHRTNVCEDACSNLDTVERGVERVLDYLPYALKNSADELWLAEVAARARVEAGEGDSAVGR